MSRLRAPCASCVHPEMCREYDLCTEGLVRYADEDKAATRHQDLGYDKKPRDPKKKGAPIQGPPKAGRRRGGG